MLALFGRVGRAGLPGALWCASPFPLAALSFCFAWTPPGWGCPPLSRCPCRFLVALALCFGCFSRPPAARLFVRSRLVCVSCLAFGCSLVVSPPPPPLLCLAVFVAPAWCLGVFFFLCFFLSHMGRNRLRCWRWENLQPASTRRPSHGYDSRAIPSTRALCHPSSSSPVRPRCLRLSLVSGPGCLGPRRCALFALLAFRFSALHALVPLSCFPPGCWLLPGGCCPPPRLLSRGFRRCRSVLCAVCCVVLCVPGCGAAPRCPVLSCAVLRSLGAAACCAVPSGTARRPGALCSAALCFAVFPRAVCSVLCVFCRGAVVRAVVRRSALCCAGGAVPCVPCPLRSVRCCASPLCCSCGVCCCWRLVLWCAVVRCWVWWPLVVCWWRVSVSVSLSGRVVCFPVVGVVCCGALLSCVVFCGAVLSRGAVLLCSAVVLRCCLGLLCPPVGCRAVLCCAVGGLCCFLPGGGVCVLWCSFPRAVCSLSSPLCALRCLVVLAVVPCFPVSCAVALCCRVVLCCRALLSFCGAVCVCFALLRPVVRRQCRLRCCWRLVLWCVPVRCGVSLGVLRCGGAALVCRGVLLCCALSCGVLRPVPCPAVPCCPAVVCWLAVLCGCLRCWCLFFLLSSFPLLKTPAVFPCL